MITDHLQAFEKCAVGNFNLSYECLTSVAARAKLREQKGMDAAFRAELEEHDTFHHLPAEDITCSEDEELIGLDCGQPEPGPQDDVQLSSDTLMAHLVEADTPAGVVVSSDGSLWLSVDAETMVDVAGEEEVNAEEEAAQLGRGKRKRPKHDLSKYNGEQFWRN